MVTPLRGRVAQAQRPSRVVKLALVRFTPLLYIRQKKMAFFRFGNVTLVTYGKSPVQKAFMDTTENKYMGLANIFFEGVYVGTAACY